MDRLTFDGNFCDIAKCAEMPCKYPDGGCSQKKVWERLKLYEDADCVGKDTNVPTNAGEWISVKERLPENEETVLICVKRKLWNDNGKHIQLVSKAIHTDGKHNTENSGLCWNGDDMDWEYDEENDAYIIPEGWWEDVDYLEQFAAVDDFVTHWMPLPAMPEEDT